MTEAKTFADKYSGAKSINLKSGSLRFFGEWFGKPLENYHTILEINYIELEDCLAITFDDKEILSVWNPYGITCNKKQFKIEKATWLRWAWYKYGCTKTPDNLLFVEFFRFNGVLTGRSNTECFDFSRLQEPAVEIF